jgi:hypothetical protein
MFLLQKIACFCLPFSLADTWKWQQEVEVKPTQTGQVHCSAFKENWLAFPRSEQLSFPFLEC